MYYRINVCLSRSSSNFLLDVVRLHVEPIFIYCHRFSYRSQFSRQFFNHIVEEHVEDRIDIKMAEDE